MILRAHGLLGGRPARPGGGSHPGGLPSRPQTPRGHGGAEHRRSPAVRRRTVSHPIGEGRAFAAELRAAGLSVELVADADAPAKAAAASLLLLGANTVFRDGVLCNKIGTRALAQAAAAQRVPVIVACELIKLAPMGSAQQLPLPAQAHELLDFTPSELVEAVVTEDGTYPAGEVHALVDRTPFLREGYALLTTTL